MATLLSNPSLILIGAYDCGFDRRKCTAIVITVNVSDSATGGTDSDISFRPVGEEGTSSSRDFSVCHLSCGQADSDATLTEELIEGKVEEPVRDNGVLPFTKPANGQILKTQNNFRRPLQPQGTYG